MLTVPWTTELRDHYTKRALVELVPLRAVINRCRYWGINKGRATQIAEDIASEAFLRSMNFSYLSEDHFRAWLTRTALNFATDVLRREKRVRRLTNENDLLGREAFRDSFFAELEDCVRLLTPIEQSILTLTYECDYTLDQIAAELNIEPAASQNARRLRVKRLRDAALAAVLKNLDRIGYS